MKSVLAFVLFLPLCVVGAAAQALAPAADAAAGKALWDGNTTSCKNCHGLKGEGGFAPDLAGRSLTLAQFNRAVREPWGIMPSFPHMNDKQIADMAAYLGGLPGVERPGPWRFPLPANAPHGQVLALSTIGCAMCHTPTFDTPRRGIAEANGDFEWFKRMVYEHTIAMPEHCEAVGPSNPYCRALRMGDYSRTRLPENLLREIYDWALSLGLDVPIVSAIGEPVAAANGVTYTVDVSNKGVEAKAATIALIVPAGIKVISATGTGYKGVRADSKTKMSVAEWQLARLGPNDNLAYSITLARALTPEEHLRGSIHWATRGGRPAGPNDFVEIGGGSREPAH